MLRALTVIISVLGLLATLSELGSNLISGAKLLVWLVDAYRGSVYPLVDNIFTGATIGAWGTPDKEIVDLFFIVFFMRNIILTYFLRDLLIANDAPANAFFDTRFTMLYLDNFLERIWFPLLLTAFYWMQVYLIKTVLGIPVTFLQVLFFWGLVSGIKGLFTGRFNTLPRWFLYPYVQYRVRYNNLRPVPSLFAKYHLWLLYIILPSIIWLNQRADTALPFIERVTAAASKLADDVVAVGRKLR